MATVTFGERVPGEPVALLPVSEPACDCVTVPTLPVAALPVSETVTLGATVPSEPVAAFPDSATAVLGGPQFPTEPVAALPVIGTVPATTAPCSRDQYNRPSTKTPPDDVTVPTFPV